MIAHLDDLLLSLPPELVQEGLTLAQEELGTVGLTLNEAKTNAWAPQPPPPWRPRGRSGRSPSARAAARPALSC